MYVKVYISGLTPILGGGLTGRPRSRLRAPGIRVSQGLHLRSHTYTGGRVDRPSSVTTTGPRNTCKSRFTSQVSHLYWGEGRPAVLGHDYGPQEYV